MAECISDLEPVGTCLENINPTCLFGTTQQLQRSRNEIHALFNTNAPKLRSFMLSFIVSVVSLFALVQATLYVVEPLEGSTCRGGQSCIVEWLDDGRTPRLSDISVSEVGLYHGEQELVQRINPVDVSATHALKFTPNTRAGPNSGNYYIAFTSTTSQSNGTADVFYSPFFRLTGMQGSFNKPLPAATSSIPIPSSLTASRSNTATIIVGTSTASPSASQSTKFATSSSASLSTLSPSPNMSNPASPSSTPSSAPDNGSRNGAPSMHFLILLFLAPALLI